ncbi:hypothetical protein J2X65_004112 [Ancylobacter sp. 3268]|uniref:DUF6538 domain-containing protein n=1 Tax=Ancylobacter sp. 3268 TaxID=2817752 RepID=UPI00285E6A1B|nr:DUF6538 domain-containing protein [Ancylobacter sp. 3268]MDR6954736.1 hypothetical protein [Ancylobacter sp. 3268]
MAQVPGLVRRGSAYTYRRRVPDELRVVIGKRELWIALETTDYRKATVEARKAAATVDNLFAEARRALVHHAEAMKAKGAEALFPDLPGEGQDQIADVFQKRFAYWSKTTLGVKAAGTSFHSFRHGFRDALREAGSPIDATRALGGWARSGGVEERYGQGTRPKTLAEVMAKVKFDGVDLSHLKPI